MTENEFILALRNELEPIKEELRETKNDLHDLQLYVQSFRLYVENELEGKIKLLAENYVPAAKRYERTTPEINELKRDIDILKKVVTEHSEKLQKIS